IENYSGHLARRPAGSTPWTLLDYFPDDRPVFVAETHMTIPPILGTYYGTIHRNQTHVDVGLRLPSVLANRQLSFQGPLLLHHRLGIYDVVLGINLLREGLDVPEVRRVAILDADKEGYLRSEWSLIQTMGRAARHVNGRVMMYADVMTDSMRRAIAETERRRRIQVGYKEEHGIETEGIRKAIRDITDRVST